MRDIPSKQLMDMVSFVFQDSKLLKMSVYEMSAWEEKMRRERKYWKH